MNRTLLAILTLALCASAFGSQAAGQPKPTTNDEETLTKLLHEWAMCTVQANTKDLEKIMDDTFKGSAGGVSFDKRMLLDSLKSGKTKVGDWMIDDVKVTIKGNAASVIGRSTLTNATYIGKDLSGKYIWTDRFVKKRDGNWRLVSAQANRAKE